MKGFKEATSCFGNLKFSTFSIALSVLSLLLNLQESQAVIRYSNFTTSYSAEWQTINDAGTLKLRMTLRYKDFDITNWNTQGENGIWMGVGYNTAGMSTGDATMCRILWTNTGTDAFVCEDRYLQGQRLPTLDANRNTVDVVTNTKNTTNNISKKSFLFAEAIFERPLISPDVNDDQDDNIAPDSNVNIIWAFGQMSSGSPAYHGSNNRGASTIYVASQGIKLVFCSTLLATLLALTSIMF